MNSKKEAKELVYVKLDLSHEHMQGIKRKGNAMLFKRALVLAKQNKGILTHPKTILLELKEFLQDESFK